MSLQVWLPLNNNLNNQGLNFVKFSGTGVTYSAGKIGYCASGTISGVSTQLSSTAGFSCSWWWKISDQNSYSITIPITSSTNGEGDNLTFGKMDYMNQTPAHYAIKLFCKNNNPQMLWIRDKRHNSGVWELDKWHHYVIRVENHNPGISVNIYVDNALIAQYNNASYSFVLQPGTITLSGTALINDFRLYNHPLSIKEIDEISKGLILHYPLRDSALQNTTNYLAYPTPSGSAASSGWDSTLHPDAIKVSGFSAGYNSGVSEPKVGYHAYWKIIDGVPTIVMPNNNSSYSHKARWMGVSSTAKDSIGTSIGQNNKYTISFEAKGDIVGRKIQLGLYYNKDGASGKDFHDGQKSFDLTTEWRKYSHTFTMKQIPSSSNGAQVYMYGHYGIEGIAYMRNIQLEINDHATDYVVGNRITSTVFDCSGFGNNGTIVGAISMLPDSGRNSYSMYESDGRYNYIQSNDMTFPTDTITMNCWVKGNATGYNNYHIPLSFKSGNYEFSLEGATGKFRAGYQISGTRQVATTSGVTIDGKWHMITSTFDGNTIRRYVDGKAYTSTEAAGVLSGGTGRLLIGNYNGTQYGNKELCTSDVRIYATALTAEQVKELYSIGATLDKGGNVYGYEFAEIGNNAVLKEGIVDFDNFIEYNIDRLSEKEKVSMFADSIEAYNYYEF